MKKELERKIRKAKEGVQNSKTKKKDVINFVMRKNLKSYLKLL